MQFSYGFHYLSYYTKSLCNRFCTLHSYHNSSLSTFIKHFTKLKHLQKYDYYFLYVNSAVKEFVSLNLGIISYFTFYFWSYSVYSHIFTSFIKNMKHFVIFHFINNIYKTGNFMDKSQTLNVNTVNLVLLTNYLRNFFCDYHYVTIYKPSIYTG